MNIDQAISLLHRKSRYLGFIVLLTHMIVFAVICHTSKVAQQVYTTGSGNSNVTSFPVSFLYTAANVSVLCSTLVC